MVTITRHEVNAIAQEFDKLLEGRSTKEIFTIFAVLNRLLYVAGWQAHIISSPQQDGKRVYNKTNIVKIAQPILVITSLKGIRTYLRDYWTSRVYKSPGSIDRVRNELCEVFKLFALEKRYWANPKGRHRRPNPCSEFDCVRALILAERCEQKLLVDYTLEEVRLDWSQEIGNGNYPMVRDETKSLPEHKAYTLVALFNMMFDGIVRWGRPDEPASGKTPLPEVVEAIKTNSKQLQAEHRFEELQDEDPERDPDEIIETESFEFVETEIARSNGLAFYAARVVAAIPLAGVVRRSMKVQPKERVKTKKEACLPVPVRMLEESPEAIAWWEERIGKSGLWLSQLAPTWVWDAVLAF
jgi:hypothetical protein